MASQNHNNETEQTAIDNLNTHLTSAGQKVADNKKYIWWVLGIIVAIAAIILSYLYFFRTPRVNKATDAYDKVELQEIKGEITDSIATANYMKVADEYDGTPAGETAALAAGEGNYKLGNWDKAIKYLEMFDSNEPVIEATSRMLLADCYVNKGEKFYGQALDAYAKAKRLADDNPQIVPMILFKEARVYDAQKNYSEALKCYEEIKNAYPEFVPGSMTIDAYIAREKARLGK